MKVDTRDKKPKVWNIALLSAVVIIAVAVLAALDGRKYMRPMSVILDLYFAAVIVLLLSAFVKQIEYNPYSYNVIYYLGFSLFVCFVLAISISLTVRAFSDPGGFGFPQVIAVLKSAARKFLYVISAFVIPFAAALAVSNVLLIRRAGFRLENILGLVLGVFLVGGLVFLHLYERQAPADPGVQRTREMVLTLVTSFYLYFECMMIGAIAAGMIAALYEPERNKDVLIILGYTLREGATSETVLRSRVDRAIAFREKQLRETGKDLIFIPSGGKGTNETLSESRWMHNYLTARGIPEDIITEEDQSTTTHENMRFSKQKIQEINPKAKIAFCTSNYHVFRSGLYARREKMRAVGIGAKTEWYFWPNASAREFLGILTEHRLKQAIILLGLTAVNVALVLLAYA